MLTSVRNERSLHRSERVNPTTRSWIPPRTFFTQVRFSRSGNFSPRPRPPAPPSGPENAGQKGQKSRPPGLLSGRPGGGPRRPAAAWAETPRKRGKPELPAGRKAGPETRPRDHPQTTRNHGNRQPRHIENAAEKAAENTRGISPPMQPARVRAKTKRRRTEKIGTEITIALKRLSGIKTARLIVDECPPDPRAGGNAMTTIVAWRRDHRISDTEIYGTKQEFRENVLDRMERNRTGRRPRPVRVYEHESRGTVMDLMDAGNNNPGLITPVHMYDHGGVLLNTEGSA